MNCSDNGKQKLFCGLMLGQDYTVLFCSVLDEFSFLPYLVYAYMGGVWHMVPNAALGIYTYTIIYQNVIAVDV